MQRSHGFIAAILSILSGLGSAAETSPPALITPLIQKVLSAAVAKAGAEALK